MRATAILSVAAMSAVAGTVLPAAQEPPPASAPARPTGQGRGGAGQSTREFLGLGRPPDADVAARGEKLVRRGVRVLPRS